jgi:hypothetical protein
MSDLINQTELSDVKVQRDFAAMQQEAHHEPLACRRRGCSTAQRGKVPGPGARRRSQSDL